MAKPISEPMNASRIQLNPARTRTPRIHVRWPPTGGAPPSSAAFHRAPVSSDAWYWLPCAPRGMNVTEYFWPPMCRANDAFIPYHGQRNSPGAGTPTPKTSLPSLTSDSLPFSSFRTPGLITVSPLPHRTGFSMASVIPPASGRYLSLGSCAKWEAPANAAAPRTGPPSQSDGCHGCERPGNPPSPRQRSGPSRKSLGSGSCCDCDALNANGDRRRSAPATHVVGNCRERRITGPTSPVATLSEQPYGTTKAVP